MTHEEIINMITPRYFVPEIEDLDSAHMLFDHFEDSGYKIDCAFEIINPVSFKWMEENNCMYEDLFKDPNTTFQEKLKHIDELDGFFKAKIYCVQKHFQLLYKQNNICKFNYIKDKHRKFFIK